MYRRVRVWTGTECRYTAAKAEEALVAADTPAGLLAKWIIEAYSMTVVDLSRPLRSAPSRLRVGWDILHDFKKATHAIAHLCGSSYDHAAVADAVGLANFDDALPSSSPLAIISTTRSARRRRRREVFHLLLQSETAPPANRRLAAVDDESVAPAGSKRFAIAATLAAVTLALTA